MVPRKVSVDRFLITQGPVSNLHLHGTSPGLLVGFIHTTAATMAVVLIGKNYFTVPLAGITDVEGDAFDLLEKQFA